MVEMSSGSRSPDHSPADAGAAAGLRMADGSAARPEPRSAIRRSVPFAVSKA